MRLILYTFLTVFLVTSASAQNFDVSGTITEEDTGFPILGANIILLGSNKGEVSDFDGNYSISDVPAGSILQFSYVGFVTQEITVSASGKIDIILATDIANLDEVVVIGYGTQKKKELTGSVGLVDSKIIEDLNPPRVEQALQGQVAGVNVTSQSGSPGSASDIRIRGISTNGDNRPFILVDGNVIEDLSVVNPGDIANITVLKDATAAIYGVRAANGVILITTKTGRKNSELKFDYNSYIGFQQTTRKIPVLNATEYALISNEAAVANGEPLVYDNVSGFGQGTDWQDEVFEIAPVQSHNLSVSGGTEKATYSFGASLLNQDGIVGGNKSNFTRYTTRMNFGIDILENLTAKANLIYTGTRRKSLPESGLGSVLFNALNFRPTVPVRDETGAYSSSVDHPIEVVNPLKQIDNTFNKARVNKISGVFGLRYDFLENFSVESNYQWNYAEVDTRNFNPIVTYGNNSVFDNASNVQLVEGNQFFRDYTFDAIINYEKSINDTHNIKATVGTSVFKTTGDYYLTIGDGLPESSTFSNSEMSDAANVTDPYANISNRFFDTRLLSYFGRAQYDFKGKYLFSGLIRRDGSTAFGPENKFGWFYAASVGWVVSDESFLENSEAISFLKIRASTGKIGNDRIPAFGYVSLLSGEGEYVFDDTINFGTAIGPISNPEIQWEEQFTTDIGLDMTLFNNIFITADVFSRTTENLLLQVQSSGTIGASAPGSANPLANAGSIRNRGLEFQIGYKNRFNDNFKMDVSYNITALENEVLSVDNQIGYEVGGSFGIGQDFPSRMQVGQPIGSFYGLQMNGIFQNLDEVEAHPSQLALGANAQPGDIRFVDINQDGVIDEDDRTFIGDPIPNFTMGLNLGFDYKNFDFQTYLFASLGNDIVRNYDRNDSRTNKSIYTLDRWTGEGSTNENPRVTSGSTSNFIFSDYFVEDGSFLRAQTMQLGYSFGENLIDKVGINKLRVYVSVSNAFTLTKYRGFDPSASNGAPIGGGIDYGFYPNPRTYQIGANLKF